MQLAQRHNTVTSGGNIGESSGFTIAMNAKMFRVLSDTMYTNKIGSIVRELASNAVDGHTKAGTPEKAFEIHVPNALEPWFSVKDTGVGMSDEVIRNVYTTYGESTKDQSNDEVGAFGLGAKTPFAYTDQFTITSVHACVSRTYVAVIADDGMPVLNMQVESPTTEPNGIEVTIAVDSSDVRNFKEEIIKQLRFFKVKPTLTNNMEDITFADVNDPSEINMTNDLFTLYKGGYSGPVSNKMYVIQGGVGYPVNIDNLTGIDAKVKGFAEGLESLGITMEFNIGAISVTASRESISYEPTTINSIKKRLTDIATLITTDAINSIRGTNSIWDRVVLFNQQIDVVKNALTALPDFKTMFAGADIDRRKRMFLDIKSFDGTDLDMSLPLKHEYRGRTGGYHSSWKTRMVMRRIVAADQSYDAMSLIPAHNMRIIIADKCTRKTSRLRKLCVENNFSPVLYISHWDHDYDVPAIATLLGVPESKIEKLTAFDPEVIVRNGSNGGEARPKAYRFDKGDDLHNSGEWTRIYEDIDELENTIYVQTHRNDVAVEDGYYKIMKAIQLGLVDYTMVAVNGQTHKRIVDGKLGDNLLTCDDVIGEINEKVEVATKLNNVIIKYDAFIKVLDVNSWLPILAEHDPKYARMIEKLESITARRETIMERAKRLGGWERMADSIDYDIMEEAREKARKHAIQVGQDYPMLKYGASSAKDNPDVVEYIKLVNNAKGA